MAKSSFRDEEDEEDEEEVCATRKDCMPHIHPFSKGSIYVHPIWLQDCQDAREKRIEFEEAMRPMPLPL
jgi:hypothetical protein